MDITKAVFVEGSPQKAAWFKNIIEEFYIKYYGRNLSIDELRELNRRTIAYMVENLKMIYNNSMRQQKNVVHQEPQTVYSRNSAATAPTQEYNNQFSKRQKEYETMVKKPLPPEINFSENIKDEPISNMEELIKQQQQMREYELNSLQTQRENIVIHNEQNVSVHPDIDETKSKKVTWSDESTLEKDVEIMKSQIAELYALVQQLQNTTKEE